MDDDPTPRPDGRRDRRDGPREPARFDEPDAFDALDEREDERVRDRLARWFRPTPVEAVGLVVLLAGAGVATALWWGQALQRPGGERGVLAEVGAALDEHGHVDGAAPGADEHGHVDGAAPGADEHGHIDGAAPGADGPGQELSAPSEGEGAAPGTAVAGTPGPGSDPDGGSGPADGVPGPTGQVTVHVSGAVDQAGLVTLAAGSRVGDAVVAAGGLTSEATPERVNLARELVDGEHVHVPSEGEELPATEPPSGGAAAGGPADGAGGAAGPGGAEGEARPIDLNTATPEELETLPGIGPAKASAIVEHRETAGPFQVPGDVRDVPGIGEATFQRLAPRVTTG